MKSTRIVAQEPYIRSRENPLFKGLIEGHDPSRNQAPNGKISRSTSDINDTRHKKMDSDISAKASDCSLEDSVSDMLLEPFVRSSPETWPKIAKTISFSFQSNHPDVSFDMSKINSTKESSLWFLEATEKYNILPDLKRPTIEKSYSINRRKTTLSKIPLPQSAASFYNGFSPQMEIVESCEGIDRLNLYLKARKHDVSLGVPGKFLHAVLGQDASGVGSIASTIMYAFYLHITGESDLLCTVPVINMKRADLNSHAELKWLLDSCQIDQSSLIFIDEIDLSYHDLFGSLKLVVINGHRLPMRQEALKGAIVEIFNCRKDCSWCTLVAEKFALTSPKILAGQRFSRILLAGILVDTGNLTSVQCTSKDKYMSTLLINGAGRFGCNGLYQILRYKMYDVSDLKVVDILRKDFKKWTRVGKPESAASRSIVSHIGMSSIGISVEQLLAHEDASTQEIKYFQQLEKVRLLMIVSGYYGPEKNFKREILVSAESVELMKNLLSFFNSNASQLPLKVLHRPGLIEEMRAFEVDKITSRKTIERLLEEFGGTSKANGVGRRRASLEEARHGAISFTGGVLFCHDPQEEAKDLLHHNGEEQILYRESLWKICFTPSMESCQWRRTPHRRRPLPPHLTRFFSVWPPIWFWLRFKFESPIPK
ncbi:hypothetical protein Q3G72_011246 [Acer saccharum]|nr:hypothetical protein Q3G72_011246 [Acer saccharum]